MSQVSCENFGLPIILNLPFYTYFIDLLINLRGERKNGIQHNEPGPSLVYAMGGGGGIDDKTETVIW